MQTCRLHIIGASGAGVTTLGRAIADALAIPHHDTDDYFHQPTNPPFQKSRPAADRLRLMREVFVDRSDWVLSGSLTGWGDELIPWFDGVILVDTPTEVRLARLRAREALRFGAAAIEPGGWREREFNDFIEWASHYDDGNCEGRTRRLHDDWLANLPRREGRRPVLRLDGRDPTSALVAGVIEWIRSQ